MAEGADKEKINTCNGKRIVEDPKLPWRQVPCYTVYPCCCPYVDDAISYTSLQELLVWIRKVQADNFILQRKVDEILTRFDDAESRRIVFRIDKEKGGLPWVYWLPLPRWLRSQKKRDKRYPPYTPAT